MFTVYNPYLQLPQDVVGPILGICFWYIVNRTVFKALQNVFGITSFVRQDEGGKSLSNSTQDIQNMKMISSIWKGTQYIITSCIGYWVLSQCSWVGDRRNFFLNWPIHPMSQPEKLYYYCAYGQSLFNLVYLPFEPIKLKDFKVYTVHHMVTLFLVHFSYMYGFHRIGCAILLVHDVADPFMEVAKCALYKGYEGVANVMFGLFVLVFIMTRNIIYPFYIVSSIFQYGYHENGQVMPYGNSVMGNGFKIALLTLQAMHIYWGYLVIKVAQRALSPQGIKDVREKDD